jgi:hypothetical protein
MTQQHFLIAVNGLGPEATLLDIATNGLLRLIVQIEPILYGGGGGGSIGRLPRRYRITINLVFNGESITKEFIADETEAKQVARVSGIEVFETKTVMVSINGVQVLNT